MAFRDKRVVLVGGGLGGLAFMNVALACGMKDVQLFEQAREHGESGAGVDVTANANRILDVFGLKGSLLRCSSPKLPYFMQYHNYKSGDYLGHIEEAHEPHARLIHRGHLLEALREFIPNELLNYHKRLSSIQRNNSSDSAPYTLHFKDGTTIDADIVIGCDGIKSAVRREIGIGDSPNYSGQVVYRGYIDYKDLPEDTANLLRNVVNFRGRQRHIICLPIGNQPTKTDRIGFIGFMTEPLENWDSENWVSRSEISTLHEHLHDWCPQVQQLIHGLRETSSDGSMMKQALYVREPVDKWYEIKDCVDSGVVLLGDAVHSTLPHQGQGVAMAIESGVALATILAHWKEHDLQAAFQFYQDLRKPRTDRITRTSYEAGKLGSSDDPDSFNENFNPEALMERMKWVMDYNVLDDLQSKNAGFMTFEGSPLAEK
ncbi:hypothetical protein N7462_007467 [Penicillium macrosclerotiorum]|uniref:uncharacterized protein n=1 Tax=Penicillium macrosclerotiorum TaxID=303699 RepID=UPI0025474B49|nr:uncharacterized protein N7462_007467 [Penicillium macrosclerotiorum]KAJ5679223.1 hypothetical protein N7462_007467 [Penicillium macrosclerotiorum]